MGRREKVESVRPVCERFSELVSRQHNGIVGDHDVHHSPFSEGAVNNIFPGNALFCYGNLSVLGKSSA